MNTQRKPSVLALVVAASLAFPGTVAAGTKQGPAPATPEQPAEAATPEQPAGPATPEQPAEAATPEQPAGTATPETPGQAAPGDVQEALSEGDLLTALEQARAARQADPSAANWHAEGLVLERMGQWAEAEAAYRAELEALPAEAEEARQAARGDIQRVRDAARGRVPGEPASTHRAELDARWVPPPPPVAAPPPAAPQTEAPAGRDPQDRIVRKWYFWVTMGAIVASAAAVAGVAIQASREERDDALSSYEGEALRGPALLRF